jgi:hypothetical protein
LEAVARDELVECSGTILTFVVEYGLLPDHVFLAKSSR